MAKFMETALGADMVRTGVALGTTHEAAVLKQIGNVPHVVGAQSAGIDDDEGDDDGAPADWKDHPDLKIATARMRGVRPDLNDEQAENAVHSIRLRRERREKARQQS